jgi:hypothetical protein
VLNRLVGRPLWLGLVALFGGLPTYLLSVQAIRRVWRPDQRWLEPVPVVNPSTASLWDVGTGASGLDLTDQLAYSGFAVAANVGLVTTVLGLGTLLVVALYLRRITIANALRGGSVVIAVVVVGVVLIVNEPIRVLVFEALTFVVVAGTVAGLSAAGLLLLQERTGPVLDVLVLGPLAVAGVFLSVVLGGLATPTLGRPIGDITAVVVRFLLLDVLSVGGFNRILEDVFELDAVGTVVFWIAVTVVLGWTLALVVRYFNRRSRWTATGG